MKKIFLTLGAATLALSSFAGTRILYQQDFEQVDTPQDAGWTDFRGVMSIASDSFGKFFEANLNGQNCGTTYLRWGQDIYMKNGESLLGSEGIYNLQFDFALAKSSSNQYDGAITVFTNHVGAANQRYRTPWNPAGYWQNYVFDMSQCPDEFWQFVVNGGTVVTDGDDGTKSYAIDFSDPNTFEEGKWYTVSLVVNTLNREVEYDVSDLEGNSVKSSVMTVPETDVNGDAISMFAEGIFLTLSRTTSIYDIDNIRIFVESDEDFANEPSISLTRLGQTEEEELNLNFRAYTISFLDGETLHGIGTDGESFEADYADCDGQYVYKTTTSGKLTAWTTVGDAKSEEVSVDVDCTPVKLPAAAATISAVEAGYGKTYILTVSNADTPLRPTIFINYEYKGVNGETINVEGAASGATVTVKEEGTLTLTTSAFGYEKTEVTVKNDIEFETGRTWDFARAEKEELKEAGFGEWSVLNSATTSGFQNWTARKRLYYNLEGSGVEGDDGTVTYTTVLPFGFISEDNTTNVIEYCDTDGSETGDGYFEGLSVFPGQRVSFMYRIGLYNPDTTGGNNKNILVKDLDGSDFVVVNRIDDYGSNSDHPICATDDEYYAQLKGVGVNAADDPKSGNSVYKAATVGTLDEATGKYTVSCPVFRIQTAVTNITVYKQVGGGSGVNELPAAAEIEGDGYYYTIDGIRLSEPTRPGLYIHNGKKIIIKK